MCQDNKLLGGVYATCIHITHKWSGEGNAYNWKNATFNSDVYYEAKKNKLKI